MLSQETAFERLKKGLTALYEGFVGYIALTEKAEQEKKRLIREAIAAAEAKKQAKIKSRISQL